MVCRYLGRTNKNASTRYIAHTYDGIMMNVMMPHALSGVGERTFSAWCNITRCIHIFFWVVVVVVRVINILDGMCVVDMSTGGSYSSIYCT